MAANGSELTVAGYIKHHLTNLTYGKLPEGYKRDNGDVVASGGEWTVAHGGEEARQLEGGVNHAR